VAGVVDSHLHVWNAEGPETPWHAGWARFADRPSFTAEAALAAMDGAGVAAAVLIPAAWDVRGSELVRDAAARHPDRFAAFPVLDLRRPVPAAALTGFRGIRQMFPPGMRPSWLDGADWLWAAAEAAGLPVMAWLPGQLSRLPAILRRHPGLRVAVDHLNLGMETRPEEASAEVDALCRLADFPGLAVKASALPAAGGRTLLRRVVDAFGADRVFWGSDLMRLPCSYREAVEVVTGDPDLSPGERELVAGSALRRWLAWNE
jgi:predicted TIM-barrel fold metal-dependent hydrolase